MNTINNPSARQYYVASDSGSILAYGYVDPGQRVDSGASSFETFTTEGAYNARLLLGGIQPEDLWGGQLPIDHTQAGAIIKARVNIIRDEHLSMPVTFVGNSYQSDMVSIMNIIGILSAISVGLSLPAGFTWRTVDNTNVPMTPSLLMGLAGTMMHYRDACYRYSWTLKTAADESDDPGSIDIMSGWPDNTNP